MRMCKPYCRNAFAVNTVQDEVMFSEKKKFVPPKLQTSGSAYVKHYGKLKPMIKLSLFSTSSFIFTLCGGYKTQKFGTFPSKCYTMDFNSHGNKKMF